MVLCSTLVSYTYFHVCFSLLKIEDGEINASINQQGGMVVFSDEGDQQDITDSSRIEILEKRLQECIALQNELSKANSQLALDPRFVQKVR